MNNFLTKIVTWIKAGYPEGVPRTRPGSAVRPAEAGELCETEQAKAVAEALINDGEFDHVDIGVLITEITDGLPDPVDMERVRAKLAAHRWPLDDPRDTEERPNSNPASARHPARTLGAVAAGRPRRAARRT